MKTKLVIYSVVIFILGILLGYGISGKDVPSVKLGSITEGQQYNATTTPFNAAQVDGLIRRGQGTLGSIVVLHNDNLAFNIYDATSTNVLTTGFGTVGQNTSTQLLAQIKAGMTVGTYTFDVGYNYGLVIDVTGGTNGTTTITYR